MPTAPQDHKAPARKQTASSEKRRREALDEGIRITVGDDIYEVRVGELTAIHSRALRQQTGWSFMKMQDLLETDPDLDVVAAVVWLARFMSGDTDVTYDEVCGEVGLDFLERSTIEAAPAKTGSEDDNPEA